MSNIGSSKHFFLCYSSLVVLHCQLLLGGLTFKDRRLNDEIIGLQFRKLSSYFEKQVKTTILFRTDNYHLLILRYISRYKPG